LQSLRPVRRAVELGSLGHFTRMNTRRAIKIACGIVAALASVAGLITMQAWYYQLHVGRALDTDLGFTHGSPYVRCGENEREVFTIHSVQPAGVFAQAGFNNGDIVVGMSITQFYRTLHHGRGKEVSVSVVDGGDGAALSERRVRHLRFRVPPSV
jgi:hypothetical protein